MPRTDSASLEPADLRAIRGRTKSVRFCPSCGYQAIEGQAVHWRCHTCEFTFMVTPASRIRSVAVHLGRTDQDSTRFTAAVEVEVPQGRLGVAELTSTLLAGGGDQPDGKSAEAPYTIDRQFHDI